MLVPPGYRQVLRLAGVQIGDHRLHLSGKGGKRIIVKGHQPVGDVLMGEFQPVIAAVGGPQQVPLAHVPLVVGVLGQDLQIASELAGNVAHPIGDPGGYADHIVRQQSRLQKSVAGAAGKDGAEGAALQHDAGFHGYHSFVDTPHG